MQWHSNLAAYVVMDTFDYIEEESFSNTRGNAIISFLYFHNLGLAKDGRPPITWNDAKKEGYRTQRLYITKAEPRKPIDPKSRAELLEGLSRMKHGKVE